MIPLGVLLHLFGILAGVVGQNLVQALFQLQEMLHVDLHIRDLTLGPGRGLVDHKDVYKRQTYRNLMHLLLSAHTPSR